MFQNNVTTLQKFVF